MAVLRENPYGNFNFLVELGDGVDPSSVDGGFSEVSGLDVEIEMVEYRTGTDKANTVRKIPGLTKYGNVTLKRGVIGSLRLWEWIEASTRGLAPRSVVITLLDEERNPVLSWKLRNARPVRHVSGPLQGGSSDIAVEELVLAHEGLDLE